MRKTSLVKHVMQVGGKYVRRLLAHVSQDAKSAAGTRLHRFHQTRSVPFGYCYGFVVQEKI